MAGGLICKNNLTTEDMWIVPIMDYLFSMQGYLFNMGEFTRTDE